MAEGAARRFAFLAGTAEYPAIADATLASVPTDLEAMRELLVDHFGYEIAGGEPLLNPTSHALRLALSDWFVAEERTPDDLVVIYYSGHGLVTRRAALHLVTHDSRMRQLPATALSANELALHFIPEDEDGGRLVLPAGVFVMLDTCYAGAGAANVASMAAQLHAQASDGTTVFALACSRPREEADEGVFTAALSEVLRNESGKLGNTQQELLSPLDVHKALNAYFAERGLRQRAELSGVNMRVLAFWPNQRNAEPVPPGLDVTVQEAMRTGAVESGWQRADPAIELARVPGAFTGRETALAELTAWLETPADRTLRVVTGAPGSGKSTLLREVLGGGDTDVAIRARGRTRADVAALIGSSLGVAEDPEGLLGALSERTARCVIVVDGLDESAEPQGTAALLATLARGTPGAKVLVGTRPHLVDLLEPQPTEVVDLDSDHYFDARDIVATVMRRLVQEADSPYRDNPAIAIAVAEQASARAGRSFLFADLIGRNLAAAGRPARPADVQEDMPDVATVLRRELDRFGADRQRVEDLLTPLAYARGKGLPWTTLWPAIATALSGRAYRDGDIAWLLEHAGGYVVEDASDGRSVYRTFHEELARMLRRDDDARAHGVFTDQLLMATARADGGYAWENADPYIRRHLATHAAHAGRIAALARDPGFLAAAEPQRLLAALASAGEERLMQVVRLAAPRAVDATVPERAAYLELVARQQALDDLANVLDPHELDPPWRCRWARWASDSPHRVVPTPHIRASTHPVVELAGRRVVFSGGLDGSIRRWDAGTGEELGQAIIPGRGGVVELAVAVAHENVNIAAQRGRLWRNDVVVLDNEGAVVAGPFRGERSPTWVRMAGGPALITLRSKEIRVRQLTDGGAVTYSAAPGSRPIRMAAITVGADLLVACVHDNGTVTLTRWTRGHVQMRRLRGAVKNPHGVALTASGLVLAWGAFGGLRRWRLDGRRAGPDLTRVIGPLTHASMDGREVLVHHAGLALEVREPASGELLARLDGHNQPSRSLASSGAWVASDDAGTLRIWDLDEAHERGTVVERAVQVAVRHPDGIRTLAAEEDAVVAVNDRGEAAPLIETPERATQLAALRTPSGEVVAVGMPEGRIGVWRLASTSGGQAEFLGRTPKRDEQSTALALRDRGGAVELLSAGEDPAHIRTWRVPQLRETRAAFDIGPDLAEYAAFDEHRGQTLAATLSDSGALRVWDVDAARLALGPFPLDDGFGDAVALGAFSTGGVVACARSPYDGTPAVLVWRLDDGRLLAEFDAPEDVRITALAPGILLGRDVVLAGIGTSTVVWNLDAQVVARIELDAAVKAVVLVPPSEFQVATSKGLVSVELRGA